MSFKLMKHPSLMMAILLVTGCSTTNPFSKEKAEDLNALTYGESYDNGRARSGAWSSSVPEAFPSRAAPAPAASGEEAGRDVASTPEEKLDASDDQVRMQIEEKRGYQSSAGYTRGDRATRTDFYDNAPNDGSLWANENDANYFFTKGKVRAPGDVISVKLEEAMIRVFAEEIKKNLTPAEQEVEMALYRKNEAGAKDDQDVKAYRNVASEDLKTSEAEGVKNRMEKSVRWSQVDLSKVIGFAPNEELRAEIIDRYQNGNFKIRAVKRVLYRGASKNVSLVAVAPAADLDDKDLINSGKLYEYKIRVAH